LIADATILLTVAENVNISTAVENVVAQIESDVSNMTNEAEQNLSAFIMEFSNEEWAKLNVSLNLDNVDAVPDTLLQFTFDNMELYAKLDLNLTTESTYKVNLYTSETDVGIKLGSNIELGVLFVVDFILTVDADIDVSGGFHIKLNDGLAFNVALFDRNVSSITL
jgi:hypothetical protein